MKAPLFQYRQLKDFAHKIFLKIGCSEPHANTASHVLLSADLRGVDSHGLARLSGYVRIWEAKRVEPDPQIEIVHETQSTAVIDGDGGLGLVIAPYAMEVAIAKAQKCGTGWVAVKNSNHFGIAATHAMMALPHDMIGIVMTNASALVAPTFSTERMLGTNPICVAIPAGIEPAFVADFATTTVANGKIEILERNNELAPLGWIQDKNGTPTQDSQVLKKGGALLPLGGDREHGSHKGFCLAAWVDIFSAVLSGANYGPWVPPFVSFLAPPPNPVGKGIGHFLGAMRVDAFRPTSEFKSDMDNWIRRFRQATPVSGHKQVIIPGDPERQIEKERLELGIPLSSKVVEDLGNVGKKFGVAFQTLS